MSAELLCVGLNFAKNAFSNKGMVQNRCRARLGALLLSLLGVGAVTGTAASGDAAVDLSAARQALDAALTAETRAVAEFEKLRQSGALSRAELDDYRTFLKRLERMVGASCQTVLRLKAEAGDTSLEPNCQRGTSVKDVPLSFPNEQTEGERITVLERRLGASLSEFDEMLLREMEQLARTERGAPDAETGSGSGTGGQSGSAGAGDDQSAQGEQAGDKTSTASGRGERTASADDAETQTETSSDRSASGAVREAGQTAKVDQAGARKDGKRSGAVERDDVPDAGDDDVVARQLREAAENETDPELREKLWEEYRRYKSGKAQAK